MKKQLFSAIALLAGAGALLAYDIGPVALHGTASQGYLKSTENNYIEDSEDGTFDFREYGINGIWSIMPKLRAGAQVFGREYGANGNDDIYLDWAYADYRPFDWLGVRAGRIRVAFGFYNETRDVDALRTEVLLPQAVYFESIRGLIGSTDGGAVYGDIPMAAAGSLSYQVQVGYRVMEADGDLSRFYESAGVELTEVDSDLNVGGELIWQTPLDGLRIGSTYATVSYETEENIDIGAMQGMPAGMMVVQGMDDAEMEFFTASAEYIWNNLTLVSEYQHMVIDSDSVIPNALGPGMDMSMPYSATYSGEYIKAAYRFTDLFESAIGAGHTDTPEEAAGQYTGDVNDYFVSLRFDVTKNVIVKLEEHYIDGTFGLFASENPDGVDEDMTVFAAKVTAYF